MTKRYRYPKGPMSAEDVHAVKARITQALGVPIASGERLLDPSAEDMEKVAARPPEEPPGARRSTRPGRRRGRG